VQVIHHGFNENSAIMRIITIMMMAQAAPECLTSVAAMPLFASSLNPSCIGGQLQPLTQARVATALAAAGMMLPCMYVTARYLRSNWMA
jgi:hypothetical protein